MPGGFRFAGDDALRKRRGKAAADGLAQLDRPQSALYQERSQRLAALGVLLIVLFAAALHESEYNVNEPSGPFVWSMTPATLTNAPALRHHPSLPDSHLPWMPERLLGPTTKHFPAVFVLDSSTNSSSSGVREAGAALRALIDDKLPQFGAMIVRQLPIENEQAFSALMAATGLNLVDYIGGVTSRPVVAPKVTPTSTEGPQVAMEPHVDNPYWPRPPSHLFLWAKTPPSRGGKSIITDARAVLRQLQVERPDIVAGLRTRRVRYSHWYPDRARGGITSWEESLACKTRAGAEQKLRDGGFSWEWVEGGLKKWEVAEPIRQHPITGEETWANMITAMHCSVFDNHPDYRSLQRPLAERDKPCRLRGDMPYDTSFGNDGEAFPVDWLHAMRSAQWGNSVTFDYMPGDVLIVDNYSTMHGRFSWEPAVRREIYMAMVAPPGK